VLDNRRKNRFDRIVGSVMLN